MITTDTYINSFKQVNQVDKQPTISIKLEKRTLGFFLLVAPLSVMMGWSVVAYFLTGDWAWQLPLGLLLSVLGSLLGLLSTLIK